VASRKPRASLDHGSDWILSAALLVALGVATWGLGSFLTDRAWWFVGMLVALIVFTSSAIVRQVTSRQLLSSFAGAVAALVTLTSFFAPGSALLAVIPTLNTFEAFRLLELDGLQSIANQTVPANADAGIVFLLCLGLAVIALVMDAAAHLLRAPALAGIPLLVLLLVPTSVRPELGDPWLFALVAAAYLAVLLVRSTPTGRRAAVGISVTALVGSLVLPLVLPAVETQENEGGTSSALTAGINPIVSLGTDLRRADEVEALTYSTSASQGQYLRLTALDDFTGQDWKPSNFEVIPGNDVEQIVAPPGLGEGIPVVQVTTQIEIGSILSRWLPVPYAPSKVTGLEGRWSWEPDALAIRADRSNAQGQAYTVESIEAAPSVEQLLAAPQEFDESFDRYLELPEDLPEIVRTTAADVAGAAATDYDAAIALQNFFRGGEFEYSEQTPVAEGYDGSGAAVLREFLEVKAGYCVHFSSAMAAMARSLDIPARIAVGFTPGTETSEPGSSEIVYSVTTYNLHAWPELYFTGVGWVRFEPTPGRGDLPSFAPLAVDDPSTPEVDESIPQPVPTSSAVPAPAPSTSSTADPLGEDPSGATESDRAVPAADKTPWAAIVLLLLLAIVLTPGAVRLSQRQRRLRLVESGSALAAWDEIYDTADDLGMPLADGRTPRQAAEDLGDSVDDRATAALARLTAALETESFAEQPGRPDRDDLRLVLRSLRRSAGLWRTIRGALLPLSLVRKWLPQAPRYELE